eukprot:1192438-Prorocentrum_minimum.AAC.1
MLTGFFPTGTGGRDFLGWFLPEPGEEHRDGLRGKGPRQGRHAAQGIWGVECILAVIGTGRPVIVRGKVNDAVVTKMPFVPAKYHKAA